MGRNSEGEGVRHTYIGTEQWEGEGVREKAYMGQNSEGEGRKTYMGQNSGKG